MTTMAPARPTGDEQDTTPLVGSIIIPAHNEASVIKRCLDALYAGFARAELDVVVVCNGCRDNTAERARSSGHPVRVIELDIPSKAAALRAGDAAARAYPRLYLDADVVLTGPAARSVLQRLRQGAIAARPQIRYDSSQSSALVRGYYRARARVPAVLHSLWGAGVYGLSAPGRSRFETFPDVMADDLWLDRQFSPDEIEIVDCRPVLVAVPRSSRDLLRILRRTYKGKAENRPEAGGDARARAITSAALHDLRSYASVSPLAALDVITYVAFAVGARLMLKLAPVPSATGGAVAWERDNSSRAA
jgi:glycosyltransferase involved in cell wall biosynthesis